MYTTLDTLTATAVRWSDRQDIDPALVVDMVGNVTGRLNRMLRMPDMESAEIMQAFGGAITIPEDFIALRSIVGESDEYGRNALQYIPTDVFTQYLHNNQEAPNGVVYYTRLGRYWRLYPNDIPDGVAFRVNYYKNLPELNTIFPTNWLLTKYPQMFLYGLLEQIYMFTMDQDRAAYWKEKFEASAAELQAESDQAHYSGTRLAIKQIDRG
ncbi:virion structural protein [Pseudomonas phage Bjorn]|uniref:Tail tubular protein A n=1 Tax=Pseudomonas phage Bjorn TaxID=2079288 RepID=A0A2K9VHC9_9CAUD|nr:virion structural protein [Pseudomonas phage Bjorn]AUV61753.1 hypothetical protein PsPhBjorn_gp63 [Pseudomonas phage Bjorn]